MNETLILAILFFSALMVIFGLLQNFSNKKDFPYTVLMLVAGLAGQFFFKKLFHGHFEPHLPPEIVFLVLLPALLFGAAMHLNFHQFRLQFKTISFLATFGLLLSIGIIAVGLPYLIGLPFGVSLLFGTIISATDPIAVLALFQSLGAPKRLTLIADGESMFNDATAVVVFRIVAAIVVTGSAFSHMTVWQSLLQFSYVFFGSLAFGAILGWLVSEALARIKNDLLVETSFSLGAAYLAFVGAEHWLHLSGVITSVIAGLVVGNLGRTRFSPQVEHFVHQFWDYLGFLAVSLVFFFATFTLDLNLFFRQPLFWLKAIPLVLLARAISVYLAFFVTNKAKFFYDEPNVPLSWQHILNWSGLRGVIPLVLVLSLPEDYVFRQPILELTFATLLFTLFVNGLTIKKLMLFLKLHLPSRIETLKNTEKEILKLRHRHRSLANKLVLSGDRPALVNVSQKIEKRIVSLKRRLAKQATLAEWQQSLTLQALEVERHTFEHLLKSRQLPESAFYDLDAQLDFQVDAIDYPEIRARTISKTGLVVTRQNFRKTILKWRQLAFQFRLFKRLFNWRVESLLLERYALVRARLLAIKDVFAFLDEVFVALKGCRKQVFIPVEAVKKQFQQYFRHNQQEYSNFLKTQPQVVNAYQRLILENHNHSI